MLKGLVDSMIKSLAAGMLRRFGVQAASERQPSSSVQEPETGWSGVARAPGGDRPHAQEPVTGRQSAVQVLARDPLNAKLHLEYALSASTRQKHYLAYAELKTAQYLGADRSDIEALLVRFRQALPDPLPTLSPNLYFRFISLASELTLRAGRADMSILDVGGGQGLLAAFVPDASYCLAEPKVNGISGTDLPFPDHAFDYVVSCHVLEHIPADQRQMFLDQMLSKSRRGIILLNPFNVEGTHVDARLRLIRDITGAPWAQEHLDCTLPDIQDIRDYAANKGLQLSVKPNGTLVTSLALVFVDYFAERAQCIEDWKKVNAFFNEKYTAILDSAQYPNAYLIYLGWPEAKGSAAEAPVH